MHTWQWFSHTGDESLLSWFHLASKLAPETGAIIAAVTIIPILLALRTQAATEPPPSRGIGARYMRNSIDHTHHRQAGLAARTDSDR